MIGDRIRTATPGARFIDPAALARINNLELVAQTVVSGFISGLHRSPYLGFSIDFAEHRAYMPGDDIRRIDWRLYARTDRFYIKQFEADTNTNFMVALDVSRSMDFASQGPVTKLDYGRFLGATLAYFSAGQRDRVGMMTFDRELVDYVPPSAKHLDALLHALDRVEVASSPSPPPVDDAPTFGVALSRLAESLTRRGIVILISDLYAEVEGVVSAVELLRHSGQEVIVFHVLDAAELDFPFDKASSFEDLETGERIPIIPEKLRERYHGLMGAHRHDIERQLTDRRIDYVLVNTSEPLDRSLFGYLSARQRLMRVR